MKSRRRVVTTGLSQKVRVSCRVHAASFRSNTTGNQKLVFWHGPLKVCYDKLDDLLDLPELITASGFPSTSSQKYGPNVSHFDIVHHLVTRSLFFGVSRTTSGHSALIKRVVCLFMNSFSWMWRKPQFRQKHLLFCPCIILLTLKKNRRL